MLCQKIDNSIKNGDMLIFDNIINHEWDGKCAFYPVNDNNIHTVIDWSIQILGNEANLNWMDVSGVTHFTNLFHRQTRFNGDISKWDVSNAVSMRGMFAWCNFNGDISKWDVSNVADMCYMFQQSMFNGDIS